MVRNAFGISEYLTHFHRNLVNGKKKSTWNESNLFSQMHKIRGERKYKKGKTDSAKYFWRSDVVTINNLALKAQ